MQQLRRLLAMAALAATASVIYGLSDDYFNRYIGNVESVQLADVNRVANAVIDPSKLAILVVGDRAAVEAGLRSLEGIGASLVVLDADGRPVQPQQ